MNPVDKASLRIAVIVSCFNEYITEPLLEGALAVLSERSIEPICVLKVPGAYELPVVAKACIEKGVDAVICLGAVIRGETAHFDIVANESARGLMTIMCQTGVPILNGVITVENRMQAEARIKDGPGGKGNKGAEAALGALEILGVLKSVNALD